MTAFERAPFRLTERDIHEWFANATRPSSRSLAMHRLVQAIGRPIRAADLVQICASFRSAWASYRHLLRPLREYGPKEEVTPLNTGVSSIRVASSLGAAAPAPRISSLGTPAGEAATLPAGVKVEWSMTIRSGCDESCTFCVGVPDCRDGGEL